MRDMPDFVVLLILAFGACAGIGAFWLGVMATMLAFQFHTALGLISLGLLGLISCFAVLWMYDN